jgi:hypothetical protein
MRAAVTDNLVMLATELPFCVGRATESRSFLPTCHFFIAAAPLRLRGVDE